MLNVKKRNLISLIFKDIFNIGYKLKEYYKFKNRFKKMVIGYPIEIQVSDIKNICISENTVISKNIKLLIYNDCKLYIGKGTYIGPNCHIAACSQKNNIIIGDNVLIADRVFISTHNYRYEDVTKPINQQGFVSKGDVIIGDGSWIGIGSSILSGVKIGTHSIIGANSLVTHDVPSYSVAAGNPARVIIRYDFEEKKWINIKY